MDADIGIAYIAHVLFVNSEKKTAFAICEKKLTMSFQSNCCDKLSIALLSCSILVVLDYITEVSSILVTYDSDKCYVYALNATKRLIIGSLLNLIIFSIYGLLSLCIKIYLSFFLITYVLSVVHTGSLDLFVCL